jgi:hypothetical protein
MKLPAAMWPFLIVSVFELSTMNIARTAPYKVEGFTLGEKIPSGSPNYRAYECKPSEKFEGYTWCQRTERRNTSRGSASFSGTILHSDDGTAIYLMANLAPVSLERNAAQKEIDALSQELSERPTKVEWSRPGPGNTQSVIAIWGQIELQRLNSDDVETVAIGNSPGRGILLDLLGDLVRSARAKLPIYRVTGGAGYLYVASFDTSNRGHRHYVAADVSQPAIKKYEPALRKVLQEDRSRASTDYELWAKVAFITRNLSLETTPTIANRVLDTVFESSSSKKLHSHVWSLLPLGPIHRLATHTYWRLDTYGPTTGYPEIRSAIQQFLRDHPSEPFREFLLYTIGDFDKALQANPNSIISDVLRYASGHRILESILEDAAKSVKMPNAPDRKDPQAEPVNDVLVTLNEKPELYDNKLLSALVANFSARANAARPFFESILREKNSPHRDDAAYMLGWLAYHQDKFKEALDYSAQAMTFGNGDYKRPAAMRQAVRILRRLPAQEQVAAVQSNEAFSQQPALWYLAARAAYRDFNYPLAIQPEKWA